MLVYLVILVMLVYLVILVMLVILVYLVNLVLLVLLVLLVFLEGGGTASVRSPYLQMPRHSRCDTVYGDRRGDTFTSHLRSEEYQRESHIGLTGDTVLMSVVVDEMPSGHHLDDEVSLHLWMGGIVQAFHAGVAGSL